MSLDKGVTSYGSGSSGNLDLGATYGKGVTDLLDRLIKVTEDNKKVQEKLLDVNKQQEGHLTETAKNTKAPPVNTTTVVNKEPEDLYSYASGIFKDFIKA